MNLQFLIDAVNLSIDEHRVFNVLGSRSIAINHDGSYAYSTRDDVIDVIQYLLHELDFPELAVIEWNPLKISDYIESQREL